MTTRVEIGRFIQSRTLSRTTMLGAVAMATSVAAMVAGEAGAGLVMLSWAVANLLGLPTVVFAVGVIASTLLGAYIAVVLFVRVYRIETAHARGESDEDVGWQIFAKRS